MTISIDRLGGALHTHSRTSITREDIGEILAFWLNFRIRNRKLSSTPLFPLYFDWFLTLIVVEMILRIEFERFLQAFI